MIQFPSALERISRLERISSLSFEMDISVREKSLL